MKYLWTVQHAKIYTLNYSSSTKVLFFSTLFEIKSHYADQVAQ